MQKFFFGEGILGHDQEARISWMEKNAKKLIQGVNLSRAFLLSEPNYFIIGQGNPLSKCEEVTQSLHLSNRHRLAHRAMNKNKDMGTQRERISCSTARIYASTAFKFYHFPYQRWRGDGVSME